MRDASAPPVLLAREPRRSPVGRTGTGEVGNVVFGRIHDPILLVQIDHRRLNIGVAN